MFELVKKHEGCRLDAYPDPKWKVWDKENKGKVKPVDYGEPWTIGWGNTFYVDGSKVKKGDKINQFDADNLMEWYCLHQIKLPKGTFSYNQREALYSLIYNIGQTAFDKSKCKKAIENSEWSVAFANWNWIKSGGQIMPGLVKRREEEKELFFEGLI